MPKLTGRLVRTLGVGLMSLLIAGCGGGGSGESAVSGGGTQSGTLSVSLTDAPACGYDAVYVTVSKVRVHQSAGAAESVPGWSEISVDPPRRINLLELANGVLYSLGQTALPAGAYQQIRLVLAENSGAPFANAVVPSGGVETALDTPSAQQSGLKLKTHFEVPAGQTVEVVLDFDACRSVVRRGNSGRFNLKPVVAAVPMVSAGAISGYAVLEAPAAGEQVTVSAQIGGTIVKETAIASGALFRLAPIAAGSYDIVFSAPGRVTRVVRGTPASIAGDTVMSTAAEPIALPGAGSAPGMVSGKITPVEAMGSVRATKDIGAGTVEVGSANADGLTGEYALVLPSTAIEVAAPAWPAPPILQPPTYDFVPVAGSAERYAIEAFALGYLTSAPSQVTVTAAGNAVQDFALSPSP